MTRGHRQPPRRRRQLAICAGAAALAGACILAASALAALGDLTQKPGTAGCISQDGTGGECAVATPLDGADAVTVSPDSQTAYVAAVFGDAVVVFDRAADGTLTKKAGTAGCVSETGTGGTCADGVALDGAASVAVSPNGQSLYVASNTADALAVFDRAANGTLTQKTGTAGCISESGTGGACTVGRGLDGARSVTVSPDGQSVYVTGQLGDAIAVFDRAANGALTQKAGTAGCISETGSGGTCLDGVALDGPYSITVSPENQNAYVASQNSNAVAVFDRASNGALTQKPGTAGCISQDGTGGACADGVALEIASSVTVSPDGANAYVAANFSHAVAVFDRAADGTLTQKPRPAGCIARPGTGGLCTNGRGLTGAFSVAVSPDGANAYVAGTFNSIASFDRAANGTLTQKAGTAGCISDDGADGCAVGRAFDVLNAVAISPDGASVYATSFFGDAVIVLDRAPAPPSCEPLTETTPYETPVEIALECTGVGDLAYAIRSDPANGTLSGLDPAAGTVTYTPDAGFFGTDSFTYGASNAGGGSEAATVQIEVAPPPPSCEPLHAATPFATPVELTLDCTGEGELVYLIRSDPAAGTISGFDPAAGTLTYTPNSGFFGTDSFSYGASNASGDSEAAVVEVEVSEPGPFKLRLTLERPQRSLAKITAAAICQGSDCRVTARGRLRARAGGRTRSFVLGPRAFALSADAPRALRLAVPAKARTAGRRALRAGGAVRVRFRVRASVGRREQQVVRVASVRP